MENEKEIKYLSPFKRMCMTIGTLPSSFYASMSYYESMVWLYEYLKNEVIPVVNNNSEVAQELQIKFEELETYIRTYFDNLDIQEEVNAKLDEMAEDGTLADMIAEYIKMQGQLVYNSVEEMKEAENIQNGSFLKTYGFYEYNDGGGALYKARTITNEDVIDNVSIIALHDNTLIAEIINDKVNLNQFGCYGDGIHDDTNAIKYAIEYATNKNMTITSTNDKNYLLSELINIGDINISLSNSTFLTDYGIKITANMKKLECPKVIAVSNPITNISTNKGIELYHCYTCDIYIPYIQGFANGLILTATEVGCCYNTITIMQIANCLHGLELYPTLTGWTNENTFIGGRIFNSGDFVTAHGSDIILIYLHGNNNATTNNNYFIHQCIEGNEGTSNGLKLKLEHARWCVFESLRYEGTNPKADITDSLYNVLNNGYNLSALDFINDKTTIHVNGVHNEIINAGTAKGNYLDVTPAGNYPSIVTRRVNGTIANKLQPTGIIGCNTSGEDRLRLTGDGIEGHDGTNFYFMMRPWGKWILHPNCDGENHALVINSGSNITNGCFLWVYDGHLYGKIGQPSSSSDGTVIL